MAEASNQGRRRRRKLAPRSGVWAHFSRFTDDDGNDKARCDRCSLVLGASTTNGTSTLRAHVRICWGEEAAATAAPAAVAVTAAPSSSRGSPGQERSGRLQDKHSEDLARMIALGGYDASIVEDDYFRSFVRGLNPAFEVPSRVAIEEMCDGIFDEAREVSLSRLQHAPGRASVAVGRAKTIEEAGEAVYIACHFIDEQWNLHKFVLHALLDGTEHYYTEGPILGVQVFDEADDDVVQVISEHGDRLSMVAYDTADKAIHPALKNGIDEINSDMDLSLTTTTYLDNVLHSIARCLLPHSDFSFDMFQDMEELHLTRQERLQLLSELDLHYEWAYDERWCACYFSLQVLRKRGFTRLVYADLFVELVCKVWDQVYRGIQRISASNGPTSNLCLVELFKLREILQAELARVRGYADIHDDRYEHFHYYKYAEEVLGEAIDIVDKAIQDWYLVWSVPLALDPRYKLRYIDYRFQRAYTTSKATKYVTDVTTNINKMYAGYTKEYGTTTNAEQSDSSNATMASSSADPQWTMHCRSQDVMAAQFNSRNPETQTELDRYMQDPLAPETEDFDILKWWKVYGSNQYPMVARMARDALAMPTCSKLSSDQLAQVRSILRGYSKKRYHDKYSLY